MRRPTNQEVIAAWEAATNHLDGWTDAGDFSRRYLLNPALFELLGDVHGLRVLDAGCGNGYLARLLARRGAQVTGVEPTRSLFALCQDHERERPLGVTYHRQDMCALNPAIGPFDRVILNMNLMDIPAWEDAVRVSASRVAPGGRLIISILHPCFDEPMSNWSERRRVEIAEYFGESTVQQTFAPSFHRPLSAYLNGILATGLRLMRVIEPQLTDLEARAINDRDAHVPTFFLLRADRDTP